MKGSTDIKSFKPFNIQSEANAAHAGFHNESDHLNILEDLYRKNDDEPDFDCEFLFEANHDYLQKENMIDPDSDEELSDEFNDNQWDADIYDPYLESTYF
ncbi:hypothetical protein [Flavobacterium chungbukense]|uniref:Uncharacterized protein n=1 Tax=Flavobacterium chungbukense TaxID=877464 RepID=A0ABP7YDQ3_9FLAO|nr:hypothetical protein [Flavobacterium chungbukense]MCC4923759.1 hypothetical protein [Flavobacterium chungbukense]